MLQIDTSPVWVRSSLFVSHRTYLDLALSFKVAAIYHLALLDINYHYAVVLDISLRVFGDTFLFTVCPMPAYSYTDPVSGLSSTKWLLDQADDFQQRHIPVSYGRPLLRNRILRFIRQRDLVMLFHWRMEG